MAHRLAARFDFMPTQASIWPNRNAGASAPSFEPASGRRFDTGIPGFDELSTLATGNIRNLLTGSPSLDRTRNAGANFAASMGLAPAGGTGDFMDRWNYDLYGSQADTRREQGLADLLNLMRGTSGTVVGTPGEILGAENQQAQRASSERLASNDLGERSREFNLTHQLERDRFNELMRQFGMQFPEEQRQFDVNSMLNLNRQGIDYAALLPSYLNSFNNLLP